MSAEPILLLLRFNLWLAAAIVLVLVLRTPARRWFGARVAYALWLLPPLLGATCFLPGRIETMTLSAPTQAAPVSAAAFPIETLTPFALALWGAGALASLALLALRQRRFVSALGRLRERRELGRGVYGAETSAAGPAVIGALRPRIVAPADFDARYSADEQRIVLAHERAHVEQCDPLINAVAALIQCVSWFNPAAHIGAKALREDQELACDERVLANAAGARRAYAEALLKTHIAHNAVPIGCAWPPANLKAIKERIAMLKRAAPSRTRLTLGGGCVLLATASACAVAWAAQPPRAVLKHDTPPSLLGAIEPQPELTDPALYEPAERAMAEAQRDFERSLRAQEANEAALGAHEAERCAAEAETRANEQARAFHEDIARRAQSVSERAAAVGEAARGSGGEPEVQARLQAEIYADAERLEADMTLAVRNRE